MALTKSRCTIIILCIMLSISLAGCAVVHQPRAAQSSSFMIAKDPSSGVQSAEPQSQQAISPLEKVMQAVLPLAEKLDKSKAPDYMGCQSMVDAAAVLGVPTMTRYTTNGMDLRNYQPVVDFCNAVKAGKDPQTAIYFIAPDSVSEYQFSVQSELMTLTITDWLFAEQEPTITKENLDTLTLWKNGWMIWHQKNEGGEYSYEGLRVQPLGEEAYQLLADYVIPFSNTHTGVLSQNWDEKHLTRLNWDFIFQNLLIREKSCDNAYGQGLSDIDHGAFAFPATDVEGLLIRYFPITAEQLHSLPAYNPDTLTYAFWGFRGGGYWPAMEVTEKKENPDGSFTLRIDVFAPEFNQEHLYTSYLTIVPDKNGGCRYISNVTDSKEDIGVVWNDGAGMLPDGNTNLR